jgi:hypothetical protein
MVVGLVIVELFQVGPGEEVTCGVGDTRGVYRGGGMRSYAGAGWPSLSARL